MAASTLWTRLDARDRTLYDRWALGPDSARLGRWAWIAVTHLGGTTAAVLAVTLPGLLGWTTPDFAWRAAIALVLSHGIIQLLKRRICRPRPSTSRTANQLIAEPDRFSFPSGHATAALSVCLCYAILLPSLAPALVPVGLLVGWSRVVLGVHFPGDVLVGQIIAALTVLGVERL